jgi:hypothetical protein
MPLENINIAGFTDQPSSVDYNEKPGQKKDKMTIEEKTLILQELQRGDLPDGARKVFLDLLKNG